MSVKKLSETTGIGTDELLSLIDTLGIRAAKGDDVISGKDQLKILREIQLSQQEQAGTRSDVTIEDLRRAKNLEQLNDMLTTLMAKQRIQALLKDDGLDDVADVILDVAEVTGPEHELFAASMLGRLANVARGERGRSVLSRVEALVSMPLPPIDSLPDGTTKLHAAEALDAVEDEWIVQYCIQEAVDIDQANKARTQLMRTSLRHIGDLSRWLTELADQSKRVAAISSAESQLVRVRRVFESVADVCQLWTGNVGGGIGQAVEEFMKSYLKGRTNGSDGDVTFGAIESIVDILTRLVELRFSLAFYPETFLSVITAKRMLGAGEWGAFLGSSNNIGRVREILHEAVLVLARQNRQDGQLAKVIESVYQTRSKATSATEARFHSARDIDPDTAKWWSSLGHVDVSRRGMEQQVGNNEDQQIGALLISMEDSREAMEKLGRAVVPFLEISDPVLAATVKKSVQGYEQMAQVVRRLARMRKLTKTELKGTPVEYNPLEHEMLGGHKAGTRNVQVIREGIIKTFGGKEKTLVKPWVEPSD